MTRSQLFKRYLRGTDRVLKSLDGVLNKGKPWYTEVVTFDLYLLLGEIPPWVPLKEAEAEVRKAAKKALARLWELRVTGAQLLACKEAPAELRTMAARSMLAKRGGKALAAKMRASGFPNLVKAREARWKARSSADTAQNRKRETP